MSCCDTDPDTVPNNSYISQKSECYFRSLNKKTMNCNCTDPFAIEVCPLHALNASIKTVTSSNEAKEENVLHFGTLPNCQCGQKYLKVSIIQLNIFVYYVLLLFETLIVNLSRQIASTAFINIDGAVGPG